VAGASDTAGIAKRQRRMAEKNRQAQMLVAVPTAAVHLLLNLILQCSMTELQLSSEPESHTLAG
jgi:hypothetical protein